MFQSSRKDAASCMCHFMPCMMLRAAGMLSLMHAVCRGVCKVCDVNCGAERWLDGCKGSSPGQCRACTLCASDEYEVSPCTPTQDRVCASCVSLPACEAGTYRQCGSGSKSECLECQLCESGHYRVGCGGLTPGRCLECAGCAPGQVCPATAL